MKGGNIISVMGGSWRLVCALQEQHQEKFTALQKSTNLAQDSATGEAESVYICQCWQQVENKFAACQWMLF